MLKHAQTDVGKWNVADLSKLAPQGCGAAEYEHPSQLLLGHEQGAARNSTALADTPHDDTLCWNPVLIDFVVNEAMNPPRSAGNTFLILLPRFFIFKRPNIKPGWNVQLWSGGERP